MSPQRISAVIDHVTGEVVVAIRPDLRPVVPGDPAGLHNGWFGSRFPPDRLLAATVPLAHAAAEEVAAQRTTTEDAQAVLDDGVLRILRAPGFPDDRPRGHCAYRSRTSRRI